MYFSLTEALKRRFIMELRRYWQYHPRYQDLVDHIQGKYSFKERPQYGIIVKTSSGNRVDLAPDNYIGIINSYVYLTKVKGFDGLAVEWVREDEVAIQNNQGRFPSPPGIYYIELTEEEQFYVDPLYDVYHEVTTLVDPSTGQLQQPPLAGSLRLYEMPARFMLYEGTNYTLPAGPDGKPTGEILLTQPLTGGRYLSADYRYPGETRGPYTLTPSRADNQAIPGCVLAFGRRNKKGDRLAVVVQEIRRPAALEYGGRWDITLDFDVLSRDVYAQQEIADQTVIYIWGILRSHLSAEGIELTDMSLGGESEEIYDETGDDYFYNSAFSVTAQTEWSVHVPLNVYLRTVAPLTPEQAKFAASLPDDEVGKVENNIKMLESLGLELVQDPFFGGRNSTYEIIR